MTWRSLSSRIGENLSALAGLAQVYLELGEVSQAELCLEQVIPQLPDEARGYFLRGQVHYYKGNYPESLRDFDRCVMLDPERSRAHMNRGYVLRKLGRLNEAITAFDRSVELNPRRHQTYQGRGTAKFELGEFRGAVIDFTRALRDPTVRCRIATPPNPFVSGTRSVRCREARSESGSGNTTQRFNRVDADRNHALAREGNVRRHTAGCCFETSGAMQRHDELGGRGKWLLR